MTQYTWSTSLFLAGCAAALTVVPSAVTSAAAPSNQRRRAAAEDTAAMATGYIYRKDGDRPAVFLRLGAGVAHSEPQLTGQGGGDHNPSDRHRSLSRFDKDAYRRPAQDYRLGRQESFDTGFQHFGPGGHLDIPSLGTPNFGGGSADESPGRYGPDHDPPPGAGILDNGHYTPEGSIEDHLDGVDGVDVKSGPAYSSSAGPLDGLGDVGDEYLAHSHFSSPLKAARNKHNTRHLDDGDEYAAVKTVGDEYTSPLKLAEDYAAGAASHADYHHGWGGHGGHGKKFSSGGGSKHSAHHYSVHGNKGGKGHKNTKSYGAGEHSAHGGEGHKGHFAGHGTSKKVHHDEAAKYGSHHTNTKGSGAGKHGEKGHGRKGHKATGFHNVYNKDEFKKDTAFYDSNDKGGHHHKGGDHASQHAGKSGSHKKGAFHGSGYTEGHKDKTTHVEGGKVSKDNKSNKGASGHDTHFASKETYGKKDAVSSGKKFAHSTKGGH